MRFRSESTERIFTFTSCPGFNTSEGLLTCSEEIWETWTSPSNPGYNSTNAPKSVTRLTEPETISPTVKFAAYCSHGPGWAAFIDKEILPADGSTRSTRTFTLSPTATTSEG